MFFLLWRVFVFVLFVLSTMFSAMFRLGFTCCGRENWFEGCETWRAPFGMFQVEAGEDGTRTGNLECGDNLLAGHWNRRASGRQETRDSRVLPRPGAWTVQGDAGAPTQASTPF